jgi:hypothetical protein
VFYQKGQNEDKCRGRRRTMKIGFIGDNRKKVVMKGEMKIGIAGECVE